MYRNSFTIIKLFSGYTFHNKKYPYIYISKVPLWNVYQVCPEKSLSAMFHLPPSSKSMKYVKYYIVNAFALKQQQLKGVTAKTKTGILMLRQSENLPMRYAA